MRSVGHQENPRSRLANFNMDVKGHIRSAEPNAFELTSLAAHVKNDAKNAETKQTDSGGPFRYWALSQINEPGEFNTKCTLTENNKFWTLLAVKSDANRHGYSCEAICIK